MTEDTVDPAAWAELVRALRTRRGWSQARLAGVLDVVESTIRNWEKAKRTPFPRCRRALLALERAYPDLPEPKSA